MSPFTKLVSGITGISVILYLFTCSTFMPLYHTNKTIDKEAIVTYTLKEVNYELTYGDNSMNIEEFVNKTVQKALQENIKIP